MMPLPRLQLLPSVMTADVRWETYDSLMSCSRGLLNDEVLAQMLATRINGGGALPTGLGLTPGAFSALMTRHFPGFPVPTIVPVLLPKWDPRLVEEREELVKLLQINSAGKDESELWCSVIIATGCMADNHLWEDLGLWSRRDLSALMVRNFPTLAAKNDRDMKWKKFLYKQLCLQEGVYLCRAPSCAVCRDYSLCFGPEE